MFRKFESFSFKLLICISACLFFLSYFTVFTASGSLMTTGAWELPRESVSPLDVVDVRGVSGHWSSVDFVSGYTKLYSYI